MKTKELFCAKGQSFSKVAKKRGHETWTTDILSNVGADYVGDVLEEECQKVIDKNIQDADVVWMSPDCTKWSLAAGNTYWTKYRMPRNQKAIDAMKMMMFCRYVANECIKRNKIFFIENPNGRCVWILDNKYLKRVWYCQYGDIRAKPTNIYTNLDIEFRTCFNGNKDCHHEAAPRGSKTGTQGLKNWQDRSRIPEKLLDYIFDKLETHKHR